MTELVFSCKRCRRVLDTETHRVAEARETLRREGWTMTQPSANGMLGMKQYFCLECPQ